eukprot:869595_1
MFLISLLILATVTLADPICKTTSALVNEGYSIKIDCSGQAITITEAHYGLVNCNTASNLALDEVSGLCDGRSTCDFIANNGLFGDPAVGCPKEFTYCFGCGDGIGKGCGDDTDCYGDLICCPGTKTCHPVGWAPLAKVEENSNIMQLNHVNSIKHNNKY